MKRKLFLLALCAFPLLIGGCSKEETFTDVTNQKVNYIRMISAGTDTKVSITPGETIDAVCWKKGDRIRLFEVGESGFTGNSSVFQLSEGEGTTKAMFIPVVGDNGLVAGKSYVAVHAGEDAALTSPEAGGAVLFKVPQVAVQRNDGKYGQAEDNMFYCSEKFDTSEGQTVIPNIAFNSFMSIFELHLETAAGYTASEDFAISSMGVRAGADCFAHVIAVGADGAVAENVSSVFRPNFSVNLVDTPALSTDPCVRIAVWWDPAVAANQELMFYAATSGGKQFKRTLSGSLSEAAGQTKVVRIRAEAEPESVDASAWNGSFAEADVEEPAISGKTMTIANAKQLAWLSHKVNEDRISYGGYTITQVADIDLGGHSWRPLGGLQYVDAADNKTKITSFRGVYDGNGYKIYNLKLDDTQEGFIYNGLFGSLATATCIIKNVTIESGSVTSSTKTYVGAIAGYSNSVQIDHCVNKADVTSTLTSGCYIGGITGNLRAELPTTTVSYCSNYGNVSAVYNVGGIAGQYDVANKAAGSGTLEGNTNYGKVTGVSEPTAGLIGVANICHPITLDIKKCANYGDVTSVKSAAGGIGRLYLNTTSTGNIVDVSGCENYGTITSESLAGIICFALDKGTAVGNLHVSDCHNYGAINGVNAAGNGGDAAGILAQSNTFNGTLMITDSSNSGDVSYSGKGYTAAGILGRMIRNTTDDVAVIGCCNTGDISTDVDVSTNRTQGGIVGQIYCGAVYNCYSEGIIKADGLAEGTRRLGGIVGTAEGRILEITACYSNCDWTNSPECKPIASRTVTTLTCADNFSTSTATEKGMTKFADAWPTASLTGWGAAAPEKYSADLFGPWIPRWNPATLADTGSGYPKLIWE